MRVLFLGSGAFGLPTLRALRRDHELVGVVSQPDKPAGRRSKLTPTPVSEWTGSLERPPPLFRPDDINDADAIESLHALDADAWVVIAYGQKLGPSLLRTGSASPVFACNLHASLLPRWRGAGPVQWTILGGDEVAGNSVITIAPRMDAGEVLAQSSRPLDPMLTAGDLHDVLAEDGAPLVMDVLGEFEAGSLTPQTQDESLVCMARKLRKPDGVPDFTLSAAEMQRKIHGLNPWPCVTASFRAQPLKLLRAKPSERPAEQGGGPGTIVDADLGLVACGGGTVLELLEVQPAGSKPMDWGAFARGRAPERGESLAVHEGTEG